MIKTNPHFAYILTSYGLEGACSSLSQVVTLLVAVCVRYYKQMQDDLKDKDTVLSCEVIELISTNIHTHEVVISEIFCRTTFIFQGIGGVKSGNTRIRNYGIHPLVQQNRTMPQADAAVSK